MHARLHACLCARLHMPVRRAARMREHAHALARARAHAESRMRARMHALHVSCVPDAASCGLRASTVEVAAGEASGQQLVAASSSLQRNASSSQLLPAVAARSISSQQAAASTQQSAGTSCQQPGSQQPPAHNSKSSSSSHRQQQPAALTHAPAQVRTHACRHVRAWARARMYDYMHARTHPRTLSALRTAKKGDSCRTWWKR